MTLPGRIRSIKAWLDTDRFLRTRKLPDGRKAAAKVMLYGFFGHNLGDDMFFDMMFRRYPDTLFCLADPVDYGDFCAKYENVRFYDLGMPRCRDLDRAGDRFGVKDLSSKRLCSSCDAAVHIGGSIYQQIADWQDDLRIRKERNRQYRDFFAVSNNFGPYLTDAYRAFWAGEFTRYSDVCFRDLYSYSLFSDNAKVRYAPDLLFSYADDQPAESEKRVSVSVINPRFRVRSFTEEQSARYETKMAELIRYYTGKGYRISLLGFCRLEEDMQEIERIYAALDDASAEKTTRTDYTGEPERILDEIRKSEIVIATRFHAMILGYVLGKKVLPVCYSSKVTNVIDDLKLTDEAVTLEDFGNRSAAELAARVNRLDPQRIAELREEADAQFQALDRWIGTRGGTVVRQAHSR